MAKLSLEQINTLQARVASITARALANRAGAKPEDFTDWERSVVSSVVKANYEDGKQPEVIKIFSAAFGKNLTPLVGSEGEGRPAVGSLLMLHHSKNDNSHDYFHAAIYISPTRGLGFRAPHNTMERLTLPGDRTQEMSTGNILPTLVEGKDRCWIASAKEVTDFFDLLRLVAGHTQGLKSEYDLDRILRDAESA